MTDKYLISLKSLGKRLHFSFCLVLFWPTDVASRNIVDIDYRIFPSMPQRLEIAVRTLSGKRRDAFGQLKEWNVGGSM